MVLLRPFVRSFDRSRESRQGFTSYLLTKKERSMWDGTGARAHVCTIELVGLPLVSIPHDMSVSSAVRSFGYFSDSHQIIDRCDL